MSAMHTNQQNTQVHVEEAKALQSDNSQEVIAEQPVPIEVKWKIPAWMLRDPGPAIEVEDDDLVD